MGLRNNINNYKISGSASFKAIIDSYLLTRKKFYPFRARIERNDIVGFHPSGLANACPRKIAFEFILEKKLFKQVVIEDEGFEHVLNNTRLEKIWDTGHMLHMLIQYGYLPDYSKRVGIKYKVEVPIVKLYRTYLIGGTLDVIILLQDGKVYIVDIKTCNSNVFNKLKKVDDIGLGYLVQANLYMLGKKIPRMIMYYWNKDNSDTKEFHLRYDKQIIKKPLKTALIAKDFLLGNSLPDMLDDCKTFGKTYLACPFSSICIKCKSTKTLLALTTVNQHNELIKI